MHNIVFQMENSLTGRFAYVFNVNGTHRLKYGKGIDCAGIFVDRLDLSSASDLANMWVNGVNSEDMDYAIDIMVNP